MDSPKRIEVHQHVLPPRYASWLRDKGVRPGGIDLPAWSPPGALKFMDGHGIATGILSVSTPGVHLGDDAEARKWAREVNEYTAELVRAHPGRFGLFATLTLPDVQGAIAEAEHALDSLRADGVVLLANNAGRYLGDPAFSGRPHAASHPPGHRPGQRRAAVPPARLKRPPTPRHGSAPARSGHEIDHRHRLPWSGRANRYCPETPRCSLTITGALARGTLIDFSTGGRSVARRYRGGSEQSRRSGA